MVCSMVTFTFTFNFTYQLLRKNSADDNCNPTKYVSRIVPARQRHAVSSNPSTGTNSCSRILCDFAVLYCIAKSWVLY
jgi:hypothetical protein